MKLVDKIQQANSGKLSDYSKIYTPTAEVIEKISYEYAIKFAEWSVCRAIGLDNFKLNDNELQTFKKEKGL